MGGFEAVGNLSQLACLELIWLLERLFNQFPTAACVCPVCVRDAESTDLYGIVGTH